MIAPGWFLCPRCPDTDNLWPASVWDVERGICQACAAEVAKRARKLCSGGCGRRVETLARVTSPMCRQCRRKLGRRRERDNHGRYRREMANQSGGER